ncbi:MAG: DAK2 domain-containing protein [Clostridia bacterium]|nr:DAK2 domain-containing protein [Clostridia bacterium]
MEMEIGGEVFKRLVFGGAANLHLNIKEVNELNVFPIPDGDTGENMYLTLKGGVDALQGAEDASVGEAAQTLAQGMLLNARGNSGVILSQLFYGLGKGLAGLGKADLPQLISALKNGVKCAYGAVAEPVEGTMLTVAREAVDYAAAQYDEGMTAAEFFDVYLSEMKKSLEKTPDLLAALKEAGVIDSGGAGLVYLFEGFCKVLAGEEIGEELSATDGTKKALDFSKFNEDSEMKFGYCTELLLQLQRSKTDLDAFSVSALIEFLSTVGDSIVAFRTGHVVKIHVHTMTPWKVLAHGQEFGEFLTVKIENMTLQHNETVQPEKKSTLAEMQKKIKRARRKFAAITVASGEGLVNTFKELGADYVVSGGQTNNPSAEDFIAAFDEVNADYIFVLPNNSNIILAAEQAAKMYAESSVRVIESKSIGEGYAALSMLDFSSDDADEIEAQLQENMQDVLTAMVTRAVRTTTVNGVDVKKDDYIGFTAHCMRVSVPSKIDAARMLVDEVADGKEFVIAAYGKDATDEEREAFSAYMSEKHPRVEFYEIDGGQEVYDFLLIVQ